MTTSSNDTSAVMSRDPLRAAASAPAAHAQQGSSAPSRPPPPPQASTPLGRAMNAVGTLSTTADILQVMGQLQLLLSHRYYRARHALAALTTKHIGEVDALLRVQSGETQTLKERQKDAVRKLLDLHKQVESEMKLEVAQLLAALEAAGCARAGHQHIDADDVSAA